MNPKCVDVSWLQVACNGAAGEVDGLRGCLLLCTVRECDEHGRYQESRPQFFGFGHEPPRQAPGQSIPIRFRAVGSRGYPNEAGRPPNSITARVKVSQRSLTKSEVRPSLRAESFSGKSQVAGNQIDTWPACKLGYIMTSGVLMPASLSTIGYGVLPSNL